ncbi:glycosyltransferase [Microbacterium sp. NPDC055903]
MPARLHAVIVARSGATARAQLLHTLSAVGAQTRRPDAVTLVLCGDTVTAQESAAIGGAVEGIIATRATTSYADALALAMPRVSQGSGVWLLAHDTAPEPTALEQLAGALERSPSAALAAPKLLSAADPSEIVSYGVTMTTLGRSVDLAAGELDQGQHDGVDEALGADIRGVLIRGELRESLLPDTALAGADEGLDLGVRARLGGGRVVLASGARVLVAPDGPAALPERTAQRAYVTRLAQLHRRLAYAAAPLVVLHWLTYLPLALWRTIGHLVGKRPAAVLPEWGAAATAMARFGAIARSRRRIRSFRTASWASIAPLRVTAGQLRRRWDDGHGSERGAVSELRFFSGGGAWIVLAALLVSIASFTSLLAWPSIAGGALLPLRDTVAALWADAAWGVRGLGVDVIGPADPFAAVVAVLGSLWPAAPSFALVLLWILALPLAVLGGWFAATRVSDRSGVRAFVAIAWALAPTFLTALVDGRPAAVLVHLLLPWVFHSAVVAHRSWGAAGAASVLLAGVVASSPSLAPAIGVLWIVAVGIVIAQRNARGVGRWVWLLVPTAVLFLPLVVWQLRHGSALALFADPALVWAGPQADADAAGRLVLATGFPTADLAGWTTLVDPSLAAFAPVLLAPLALLALAAAAAPRWRAGVVLLLVALVGTATAFAAVGVAVGFVDGVAVAIWPGVGLSLTWAGVVGAAGVTLDTLVGIGWVRTLSAAVTGVALAVCAVPALAAFHSDRSAVVQGGESTLPALIAANARADEEQGTLELTPLSGDRLAARVIWGSSETLGAQTSMLSTATLPQGTDISAVAVDLISGRDFDAAEQLAELGIDFVLIREVSGSQADAARAFRLDAIIAVDQRSGFVKAGEVTGMGALWRLEEPGEQGPAALDDGQRSISRAVGLTQLVVFLAAVLLAVPTRASRRAARAVSRIVGKAPEEPLAPVRRPAGAIDHYAGDEQDVPAPDETAPDPASAAEPDPDSAPEPALDPPSQDTAAEPVAAETDDAPQGGEETSR